MQVDKQVDHCAMKARTVVNMWLKSCGSGWFSVARGLLTKLRSGSCGELGSVQEAPRNSASICEFQSRKTENTMELKAPVGDLQQVSLISSLPEDLEKRLRTPWI